MDSFKAEHKGEFYDYNKNITDKDFAKVSHQLMPGKTYMVKLFGIKKSEVVSSESCLNLYHSNKAYYTGAQGVSVLYEHKKEKLIKGKWHCSFDEKANLPIVGGCNMVPGVGADSGGGFRFGLAGFKDVWDSFLVWEGCHSFLVLVLFCDCGE